MSVLYIALPVAILLALAAVIAFVWTVSRGQYDDLDTPALRMLEDDERRRPRHRPASESETSLREEADHPHDSRQQ